MCSVKTLLAHAAQTARYVCSRAYLSSGRMHLLEPGIVLATTEHLRVTQRGMGHGCLHCSCMNDVRVKGRQHRQPHLRQWLTG